MKPTVSLASDPRIVSAVLVLGAALIARGTSPTVSGFLGDFCTVGVESYRAARFFDYAFSGLGLEALGSEAPLSLVLVEGQIALEEIEG